MLAVHVDETALGPVDYWELLLETGKARDEALHQVLMRPDLRLLIRTRQNRFKYATILVFCLLIAICPGQLCLCDSLSPLRDCFVFFVIFSLPFTVTPRRQ